MPIRIATAMFPGEMKCFLARIGLGFPYQKNMMFDAIKYSLLLAVPWSRGSHQTIESAICNLANRYNLLGGRLEIFENPHSCSGSEYLA